MILKKNKQTTKKHEKLPSKQRVKSTDIINCGRLNTWDFVCGTMPDAKSSLHWSVIYHQVTFSDILDVVTGLQIYGGPGSLSHDFKIWSITFQGSGPILFSCEKISH